MLHQLYHYADSHKLAIKYGFASDKCRWVIDLDKQGEFLALRKIDREFPLCPKYPSNLMNAGGRAHFLLEAFNKTETPYFVNLMDQAAQAESIFLAAANFLHSQEQKDKLAEHFQAQKAKDTDKVTFTVGGEYLVNLTSWHDWWQQHVRMESGEVKDVTKKMLCLLDGMPVAPVEKHDKIKIARAGGMSSGSVLVGFDKDAFSSYGLESSQNAAMSENTVLTYTTALNHMIQNAPKPLGNVLVLHGYEKPVPPDDDFFTMLSELDTDKEETLQANAENRLKEMIAAVQQGQRSNYLYNHYYVFMVSGAAGRVMVRDYFEGDCKQLADSFNRWFNDLVLISPKGGDTNTPKLAGLLTRLVSFREGDSKIFQRIGDEVSPFIPAIWRCILANAPLPDALAAKALHHLRSRLLKTEKSIPDTLACMWLKIWLIRGGVNMSKGLNCEESSQAYQLGRLLAVYAKLQEDANPGINVGVGQRYFSSASTTPALVLGRLAALSNHHLAKLNEGSVVWYKRQLQEVASNIHAEIPDVMNLKDQSLFALGYYHQMADFYQSKAAKKEEE